MRWFELLSLGLDAVTYAEINRTREQVEGIKNSDALIMLRKEIYNSLKNLVFASRKSADAMQGFLETAPQKVLVGSTLLDWRLKRFHIKPEIFDDFGEKKFVDETLEIISQSINLSKTRLTKEQIQDAESSISYVLEMPELNEAIEHEKENSEIRQIQAKAEEVQKELKTTDSEWGPLSKAIKRQRSLGLATALLVPVAFCFIYLCCITFLIPLTVESDTGMAIGAVSSLALTIGAGLAFVGGLIYAFRSTPKRYTELSKLRNEINSKLPKAPPLKPVSEKFSGMGMMELSELRITRQNFIKNILGDTDEDFNYDMIFLED